MSSQTEISTMPLPTENQPTWLRVGVAATVLLSCLVLLSTRMIEPDLWGHIQYGEDWLSDGSMPRTATHTYTAKGHPWINHENLFELAVALGQRFAGGTGLMILKTVAGLLLLTVMLWRAVQRGVSVVGASLCLIPVTAGLAEFWLMRPQLFSFLLFALQLLFCERAFGAWQSGGGVRFRWLWLCIPMLAIWTNSHGGVLAGLCVFLALLGLRSIEAVWRSRSDTYRIVLHFAALAVAAIAMLFVNPYGWELPYWLAVSLSQPRPEVSEWAGLLDGGPAAIPFLVLTVLTVFALRYSRRQRDWVEAALLVVVALQTPGHIRHLAFFALMFGLRLPEHLASACSGLLPQRSAKPLVGVGARIVQAELGLIIAGLLAVLIHRHAGLDVNRDEYPVDAIEFMDQHRLHGKLAATFDWAQYSLAALAPATTLGFDGRYDTCYPQRVVDMHFDLLFGRKWQRRHRAADAGPIDPNAVLNYGMPDLVLLNRRSDQPAVEHLDSHPDWTVLYQDGQAVLYGRRCVYQNLESARNFPEELRRLSDVRPAGSAPWPAFPGRSGRDAFSPQRAAQMQSVRLSRREQ
jgi:hypothetical protein